MIVALRLGEVLIQNGIINEAQLKKALDAQLIYGGHLGTCLVELGFVDVDVLASVLSKQFNVGHADREWILKIDAKVLGTLSDHLVTKHEVIPFDLKNRILHVAMIDPKNLLALDELSFASGYKIEAWIAPEILVHRAMEHYYKVPRKLRHIGVSRPAQAAPQEETPAPPPVAVTPPPAPAIEPPDLRTAEPEAEPPPEPAPAEALRDVDLSEEEPSVDVEGFEAQKRPSIHTQQEQQDDSDSGQVRDGKLTVDWIKRKQGDGQHWCDLYRVPVTHEHFNDVGGVYVIWHNGHNPVLRVGQGYIRTELSTLKLDPRIRAIAAESPVFASWAQVDRKVRDGVERYLIDMLGPQIAAEDPDAKPIEVNLPC
jgi:hypothetical protein